jgi:son of sevenless-like protein
MTYIDGQLAAANAKELPAFWTRSQELQQAELAHADIRKGLEAAGF